MQVQKEDEDVKSGNLAFVAVLDNLSGFFQWANVLQSGGPITTCLMTICANAPSTVNGIVAVPEMEGQFDGIKLCELDATKTVGVSGQFEFSEVKIQTENKQLLEFILDIPVLLKHIKHIPANYSMTLSRCQIDSAVIKIVSSDPSHKHVRTSKIPVLDVEANSIPLTDWPSTWRLEIPLSTLVKNANEMDALYIRLRVYKHRHNHTLFLVVGYSAFESQVEEVFITNGSSVNSAGTQVLVDSNEDEAMAMMDDVPESTAPQRSEVVKRFDATYPLKYIHQFLKSTERRRSVIYLGVNNNVPLCTFAPFGPKSYIAFIQAPSEESEDQTDETHFFKTT